MSSEKILMIGADNFEQEVEKSDQVVLVDFFADWCGPCKMLAPVLDELAEETDGKAKIGKINVDQERDLAKKFRVMSVPSILFFKDGKEMDRMVGAHSKEDLLAKIDSLA